MKRSYVGTMKVNNLHSSHKAHNQPTQIIFSGDLPILHVKELACENSK